MENVFQRVPPAGLPRKQQIKQCRRPQLSSKFVSTQFTPKLSYRGSFGSETLSQPIRKTSFMYISHCSFALTRGEQQVFRFCNLTYSTFHICFTLFGSQAL
eukprot:GILJ01007123.1.p2 GENE.GILJ01007123.1~~GILJ01007123.1.p2  ORF type:complete len:101 (+),score=1.34 GILJ01007123.1:268-570(+)